MGARKIGGAEATKDNGGAGGKAEPSGADGVEG